MKKTFFTPGPSQLHSGVESWLSQAIQADLFSLSHRSKAFEAVYVKAVEGIKALLNVPSGFEVMFFSSATEIWERIIQNCVQHRSYHLVNGSFSKRFFETSMAWDKSATAYEVGFGEGFEVDKILPALEDELIGVIMNETSTGVKIPSSDLKEIRRRNPDALIFADCVSAFPGYDLDFAQVDGAYFSIQKGFGLPAGLGVLLIHESALARAEENSFNSKSPNSYHSFQSVLSKSRHNQTPETPNVLAIFLLGQVCEAMMRQGRSSILKETATKAQQIYETLEAHPSLTPFVKEERIRSQTVAVAQCRTSSLHLIAEMGKKGYILGSGYGKLKETQIRIANFPSVSPEEMSEMLLELSNYTPI